MPESPRPNPFEATAVAAGYDAWYATPLGAYADRVEKALIARLARPHAGERVLDVGTGTGHAAVWLADMGLQVSALDASAAMLEVARARRRDDIAWRQGSASALPYADGAFDLVLSVTMLEFVERPADAVAEMVRVLRPGGRLVVAVLNRHSTWAEARLAEARRVETPFRHAHFFTPEELVALLGRHGLVRWGSALFVGPEGQGLRVGGLLEVWGRTFRRDRGALLTARVDKPAEGAP